MLVTLRSDHTRLLACLFCWCLMIAKERTLAAASAAPHHQLLHLSPLDGVARAKVCVARRHHGPFLFLLGVERRGPVSSVGAWNRYTSWCVCWLRAALGGARACRGSRGAVLSRQGHALACRCAEGRTRGWATRVCRLEVARWRRCSGNAARWLKTARKGGLMVGCYESGTQRACGGARGARLCGWCMAATQNHGGFWSRSAVLCSLPDDARQDTAARPLMDLAARHEVWPPVVPARCGWLR